MVKLDIRFFQLVVMILAVTCFPLFSICADNKLLEIEISIINHEFVPNEIIIPAGRKIRLNIHNTDETTEEFDSIDLKREKIIPGNSTTHIILAPLKVGIYEFIGEFHEATAKGKLIVIQNIEQTK